MDKQTALEKINAGMKDTMVEHLGIIITDLGEKYIAGKMPVDHRTTQPFGLLHGGASVVLAESLGSLGGNFALGDDTKTVVGVEVNANHIKAVRSCWVYGEARTLKVGGRLHVWKIQIKTENGDLVCDSRLTLAIVNK